MYGEITIITATSTEPSGYMNMIFGKLMCKLPPEYYLTGLEALFLFIIVPAFLGAFTGIALAFLFSLFGKNIGENPIRIVGLFSVPFWIYLIISYLI